MAPPLIGTPGQIVPKLIAPVCTSSLQVAAMCAAYDPVWGLQSSI